MGESEEPPDVPLWRRRKTLQRLKTFLDAVIDFQNGTSFEVLDFFPSKGMLFSCSVLFSLPSSALD